MRTSRGYHISRDVWGFLGKYDPLNPYLPDVKRSGERWTRSCSTFSSMTSTWTKNKRTSLIICNFMEMGTCLCVGSFEFIYIWGVELSLPVEWRRLGPLDHAVERLNRLQLHHQLVQCFDRLWSTKIQNHPLSLKMENKNMKNRKTTSKTLTECIMIVRVLKVFNPLLFFRDLLCCLHIRSARSEPFRIRWEGTGWWSSSSLASKLPWQTRAPLPLWDARCQTVGKMNEIVNLIFLSTFIFCDGVIF